MPAGNANSLHIFPVLVTGPQEIAELAGIDVIVNFKKTPLIKIKCTRKLLHELPGTFNELGEDRRHFLGVPF